MILPSIQEAAIDNDPGAVNNLMTDCAECYSLSFDAGPASYELHDTSRKV